MCCLAQRHLGPSYIRQLTCLGSTYSHYCYHIVTILLISIIITNTLTTSVTFHYQSSYGTMITYVYAYMSMCLRSYLYVHVSNTLRSKLQHKTLHTVQDKLLGAALL